MTSVTPWSVKGITPRAREVAKDLARRSGMTLGEWLNRVILDDEEPEEATSEEHITQRPTRSYLTPRSPDELARVLAAVDSLQQRLETAETRTAGAVSGLEQSVRDVMARLEAGERDQVAVAARFEGVLEELNAGQGRLAERLRKYETDGSGPRSAEALRSLEQALGKVAHHLYDGESRTREMLGGVEARMARLEASGFDPALGDAVTNRLNERLAEADARATGAIESLRASFEGLDGRLLAVESSLPSLGDQVAGRVSERLAEAEAKTSGALESLRASFEALDGRLHAMEGVDPAAAELRLSDLAASLTSRVEAARAEIAERLWTSSDERFDQMERRLAELAQQVAEAEERSAQAIEDMGNEVLSIADTLNRRVEVSEQRAAEAIEQAGGEMARIAAAMETRLGRTEAMQADALQRLGEQLAGVTDRLGERIASAERRSAEAMDDVGEKLERATNRLNLHQDRTSEELAERILMSEERTVRRLEDVLERDEPLPEPPPEPAARSSFSPFAIAGFDDLDQPAPAQAEPGFEPAPLAAFPAEDSAAATEPGFDDEPFDATEGYDPTAVPFVRGSAESAGLSSAATYLPEPSPEPELPTPLTDESGAPGYEADDAFEAALFGDPASRPTDQQIGEDETTPFAAETEFVESEATYAAPTAESGAEDGATEEEVLFVDDEPTYEPSGAAVTPEPTDAFEDALFVEEAAAEPTPTAPEMADRDPAMPAPGAERPLTTRELIEQARAAARASTAAAAEKGRKAGKPSGGGLFSSFGVPGRKKRSAGTVQTALLVAGGAAFLSVGAAGLVVMGSKPGGAPTKRLAENSGPTEEISQTENEALAAPRAAVAMTPRITGAALPAAGGAQPDLAAAYDTAVRALEASDPAGVSLLRNAANLGHAPAQLYLATLYENGRFGVNKNLAEARRWTQRAAQAGDRKAMHNLALYAFEGVGGEPRDPALAAQWFRRAADLGLVDSQYNLGRLYEQGLGVSQNMAEAYKWYLIAARSGDGEAAASAQRVVGAISPDAQAVAQRAAGGFRATAATPSLAAGEPSVIIAQRALSRLGYYQGPRDGVASPALTMALAAYQREQNLPATGALDDTTISKLAVFTR